MISEKLNTLHGWMIACDMELTPDFSQGLYLDMVAAFRRLVEINTPIIEAILEEEPEAFWLDEEHILTNPAEICAHFCVEQFAHPALFSLIEVYLDIYP